MLGEALRTRPGTTVFSLDVTNADSHSLEVGLERVAEDTGRFYAKTHQFLPGIMRRLRLALSGHYVLAKREYVD